MATATLVYKHLSTHTHTHTQGENPSHLIINSGQNELIVRTRNTAAIDHSIDPLHGPSCQPPSAVAVAEHQQLIKYTIVFHAATF